MPPRAQRTWIHITGTRVKHFEHKCYNARVDKTIRNLDERAYRELKARARLDGKSIGELVSEAIRAYLARSHGVGRRKSLRDLRPQAYPEGNERISLEIDQIAYRLPK